MYYSLADHGYVQNGSAPAPPSIPPIGSGSIATAMAIDSGTVRATIVEGTESELGEIVIAFSEPFNRRIVNFLQMDAPATLQGSFRIEGGERYLDPTRMGFTLKLTSVGFSPPGTYRGTASFAACDGFFPTISALPAFCAAMYSNASGSVPYDIVVRGITTTFTPVNPPSFGGVVGRLTTDVPVRVPYLVKAFPSAPFLTATVVTNSFSGGYDLTVTAPPATPAVPRGTVLTGNVLIRVCRDNPDTCADPHQGSPFNVTVSYTVP